MNGAIKYFREHGLKKSKKHLLDIREAANQVSWVHSLEGFSQDLKRLVESHELVGNFGGIKRAKRILKKSYKSFNTMVSVVWNDKPFQCTIQKLEQAIADVGSCLEADKKLEGL